MSMPESFAAPLGGLALKILQKLAAGQSLEGAPDTGLRLGSQALPLAVGRQLRALEAIAPAGDGWGLSPVGRALLRRRSAKADGFAAQHRSMAEVRRAAAGRVETLRVNAAESPLGWLFSRKMITPAQYQAGERLRTDFECARLGPSLTMRLDGMPIGGKGGTPLALDPTEAQIAAKKRFDRAVADIGPGLADMLVRVCCHLQGLEDAEHGMGWPARSGKVVLGLALDRLAAVYGLA